MIPGLLVGALFLIGGIVIGVGLFLIACDLMKRKL
jgi:hypothetical protein